MTKTPVCILLGIVGVIIFMISTAMQTRGWEVAGVPWEHRIYESGGQHYYHRRGGDIPKVPDANTMISPERYSLYERYDYAGRFLAVGGIALVWYGFGVLIIRGLVREMKEREKAGLRWWQRIAKDR